MKYIVTGCCGFIGCNLTLRLLQQGHTVVGIDRVESRHGPSQFQLTQHPNFKLYDLDLSDYNSLSEMPDDDYDMIYHLAANADVRFSSVYPEKDLEDGIIATFNVLRFIKERGIKKIA